MAQRREVVGHGVVIVYKEIEGFWVFDVEC